MCFLRGVKCIDHDGTGCKEEVPGCFGRTEQRSHQEAIGSGSCTVGRIIHKGRITGQRHTDEVHQVVTGKSQCQCKCSQQHHYLKYIDFTPVQNLHQDGEEYEERYDQHSGVLLYPVFVVGCHERTVLQTLYQHEVDDGSGSYTAEQRNAVLHVLFVVEGENDTCQPLYQHTEEERDGHRYEDGHDDGQGLVCVDEVSQTERIIAVDFDKGQCKCTSQQLEYHRYSGGSGKTHAVEYIQQYDIGQHDRQQDTHDFGEIEMFRLVDTVPGNVHHAVTE